MNSIKHTVKYTILLGYVIAIAFFQASFGGSLAVAADFPADGTLIPENIEIQAFFEKGTGEPIGSIETLDGKGLVIHHNKDKGYRLAVDSPLYPDDTIITREDSRLQFRLKDGSQIIMNPLTKMTLDLNIYDPESKQRHFLIRMAQGKARYLVKKLIDLKQSRFQVWTKTFIVGTRDSDFVIEATAVKSIVTALQDTVLDILSIIAIDAPPTVVSEYHRTQVEKGEMPTKPYRVPADEIDALIREMDVTLKETRKDDENANVGRVSPGGSNKGGSVGSSYITSAGQDFNQEDAMARDDMVIDEIIELPVSTHVVDAPDDSIYNVIDAGQAMNARSAASQQQNTSETQSIQSVQEDIYEDVNQELLDPEKELFELPDMPTE